MSGSSNPYGGSFGTQMTASASFGAPAAKAPAAPAAAPGDLIKDTTTSGFARDVLEASRNQPVLVDFWAPWCGPCKQLTPVIEKVVKEAAGRVRLVKMNIDEHPSIAGQLGIQSIPAVIAFSGGRPVDGFMGALPESQVREFIDRIAGPAVDAGAEEIAAVLAEAKALAEEGAHQDAAGLYSAVLQAEPENIEAVAGLAQVMIAAGAPDQARALLADLPEAAKADPALAAIGKKLDQIEEARKLGDPAALEAALAANPDDHEARLKLAKIRNVEGDRSAAAEHLLTIMRKDRSFGEDAGRRELLQFFEVWGPTDPATIAARRRLSALLFS
ncbi:thioredoxin [Xaviernesmea oryzae]|uniref:Thioredoxin n=1 Tax=Xaviernesmea oryzae TaxID=464029 RepID=A0A1Q9AXM2_9HYPH|nr:thioredoxin [Xaviernesmea oryzae]OLP60194.1 thioredoxin [Xaviernesmea oryzae]SEK29258.1 thioredoxin [Xaviernesmea oryzae]